MPPQSPPGPGHADPRADPPDLSPLTVYHGENPRLDYHVRARAYGRRGRRGPDEDVADAAFWPVEEVRVSPDLPRDADREQIRRL